MLEVITIVTFDGKVAKVVGSNTPEELIDTLDQVKLMAQQGSEDVEVVEEAQEG